MSKRINRNTFASPPVKLRVVVIAQLGDFPGLEIGTGTVESAYQEDGLPLRISAIIDSPKTMTALDFLSPKLLDTAIQWGKASKKKRARKSK